MVRSCSTGGRTALRRSTLTAFTWVGAGPVGGYGDVLKSYPPNTIEGIEFYRGPGETPVEYQGAKAQCGVTLIWSRAF